jgi:cobyrinic acid a,c-diamide synthase
MVKTLVIAGTQSGVGKTTIAVGLMAALRARGLTVQPFKVGPDYIDPSHHSLAAERTSRNLDTWMMPPERTLALFHKSAQGADVALVEGVMGLYDGHGYDEETGSTAQLAKLLQAPILLVMDVAKMARSAAALATGFQKFDSEAPLAGFILNRVGSEKHGRGLAGAITNATGLPVLGWLPRSEELHLPERHLGLVPSAEPGPWPEFINAAAKCVSERLNIDQILEMCGSAPEIVVHEPARAASRQNAVVIAVARDEAFHFCYQENLELLEEAGAKLAYFSPLKDELLPAGTGGVVLSGGFPEIYAEQLSANRNMHQALRQAHAQGLPIYAECGGLMYLTECIVDFSGREHLMVGLLPGRSIMTQRLTLGYRQANACADSWLFVNNEPMRGHEFHYSHWEGRPENLPPAFVIESVDRQSRPEGACMGNLWASYVHLHFWGKPELAARFVAACRPKSPCVILQHL